MSPFPTLRWISELNSQVIPWIQGQYPNLKPSPFQTFRGEYLSPILSSFLIQKFQNLVIERSDAIPLHAVICSVRTYTFLQLIEVTRYERLNLVVCLCSSGTMICALRTVSCGSRTTWWCPTITSYSCSNSTRSGPMRCQRRRKNNSGTEHVATKNNTLCAFDKRALFREEYIRDPLVWVVM